MQLRNFFHAVCAAGFLAALSDASAVQKPVDGPLPNLDTRKLESPRGTFTTAEQQAALQSLGKIVPGVRADADPVLVTPKYVATLSGFLTGPNGAIKGAAVQAPANDADAPAKNFLNQNMGLFGQGADILTTTSVKRDSVGEHNGMRTKIWEQNLDGIAIFGGQLVANTTKNGELVTISSTLIPRLAQVANASAPNRAALEATPPVSAAQAVANAAQNIGETLAAAQVAAADQPQGAAHAQHFTAPTLKGTVYANLVWMPMNRSTLRLAWDVTLTGGTRRHMYRLVVDAQTGAVLLRRGMTFYISDATYNVWTGDSPSPMAPGCPTPVPCPQPSVVARTLVVTNALSVLASPEGWIPDTSNISTGNNLSAFLDLDGDEVPQPAEYTTGSPARVFNFPVNLNQDPSTYTNMSVTSAFYWENFAHDMHYIAGFTEAAGNFQANNFGRGGVGGDHVNTSVQSIISPQNAFMSASPTDGIPPDMVMGIFPLSGGFPSRDSSLDASVLLHEFDHGVQQRLVGGGVGVDYIAQSGGMMEGWSDFTALTLISQPGQDPLGTYPVGGYLTYQLISGFTENYYFGIRRYPYCLDMSKDPLTFKDIDPTQADPHNGVPISPLGFQNNGADEVHNVGEVWCIMLWECRARLVAKYGFAIANPMVMRLITDGMKLGPANPNFTQSRDAILTADTVNNGGANVSELWAAFARRGLGFSAFAPAHDTTIGVIEAFDVPLLPTSLVVYSVSVSGGNSIVDPNECNGVSIILTNTSDTAVTGPISAELSTATQGVVVTSPVSTFPTVPAFGTATNTVPLFGLSTTPGFRCGTTIVLDLTLKYIDAGSVVYHTLLTQLASGATGGVIRVDNTVPQPIADLATVVSTNYVTGISGNIESMVVSLQIDHTFDSDLSITLIAPDGTSALLSGNNGGAGRNYGTDCTDANRTTFSDAALSSIITTNAPFVGTFQPQNSLSVFSGMNPNGVWQLRVVDSQEQDVGTLNCWSLLINPAVCTDGTGPCNPVPAACLDKNVLDFGQVIIGQFSPTQRVTILSCGTSDLLITNVVVSGLNSNDFVIVSPPCIGILGTNQICTVDIKFAPSDVGLRTATLVVTDNANGPQTVELRGNGADCSGILLVPQELPLAYLGASFYQTLVVRGGTPPYKFFRVAGSYPQGLTLTPDGIVLGAPTESGTFDFRVEVMDANACLTFQWYRVAVNCGGIVLSPSSLPVGQNGAPYSQVISAIGTTPPYTFTVTSGSLPTGMGLASNGLLSGVPTSDSSYFVVSATDANGCVGTQGYTLLVSQPPPAIDVLPPALPGGFAGQPLAQTITAHGGNGSYRFSVASGSLPSGVTLSTSGMLAGVPVAGGAYNFTVLAADSNGKTGATTYTLLVSSPTTEPPPDPTTPPPGPPADLDLSMDQNSTDIIEGHKLTYTITVYNHGPNPAHAVTVTDTLPSGVDYVSGSTGCVLANNKVTCNLGTLANGGQAVVTIVVVPTASGSIVNSASAVADEPDPSPGNNGKSTSTSVNSVPPPVNPPPTSEPPPVPASAVQFAEAAYLVTPNVGAVTVAVTRSGDTTQTVTVQCSTEGGTATPGSDFVATSALLTFGPGVTSQAFSVPIVNSASKGRRSFSVTLSAPTGGGAIAGSSQSTVTIMGNSAARRLTFSDADGDQVTLSLIGSGGMVAAWGAGNPGAIDKLSLIGTDAGSSLKVLVKKGPHGDGIANVGSIVGSGAMKSISAKAVNLTGAGVDMAGYLASLTIGDVSGGSKLVAGGLTSQLTTIIAHVLNDGAAITTGCGVKSIVAASIGQVAISAPTVGPVTITGDKGHAIKGVYNGPAGPSVRFQ